MDEDRIILCFNEYMTYAAGKPPTKNQFITNIERKENDPDFTGDIEGLLRAGIIYNQNEAFEWLKNELIEKLK